MGLGGGDDHGDELVVGGWLVVAAVAHASPAAYSRSWPVN